MQTMPVLQAGSQVFESDDEHAKKTKMDAEIKRMDSTFLIVESPKGSAHCVRFKNRNETQQNGSMPHRVLT